MNRMKLARECVEIDEAGGNVLDFLRMRGCISPWGTWYRLQIEELGRKQGQITEGKGGNDMKRVTLEQKKRAVEIAMGGGDPLAYLKSIGSKQPPALWYAIRKGLQDADPAAYERLMSMKKDEPVTCCAPSTRKGVEVPDEIPEELKTLGGSAWEIYSVPEKEARPGIGADVKEAIRPAAPEEKTTVQLTAKVVPVKLEEVKERLDAPAAEEKPDPGIVSTLKYDRDGNLRMEVGRPLEKYGIEVTGLKTKVGEFTVIGESMSWNTPALPGLPVIVTLPGETWRELMAVLPIVMETLNI